MKNNYYMICIFVLVFFFNFGFELVDGVANVTAVALYDTSDPVTDVKIRNLVLGNGNPPASNLLNYGQYPFFTLAFEVNSDTRCIGVWNTATPSGSRTWGNTVRIDTSNPFAMTDSTGSKFNDWVPISQMYNYTITAFGGNQCGTQGNSISVVIIVMDTPFTTNPLTTNPLTTSPLSTAALTTAEFTSQAITSGVTSANPTTSRLTTSNPTTSRLTTSALTTSRLTTANPTTSALTTARLTTSVLTTSVLTTQSLTTSPITSNEITSSEVTSSPITSAEITSNEMTSAEITSNEMTSSEMTTSRPDDTLPENNTTGSIKDQKKGIQNNKGALIGIIVGGAAFLILVVIIIVVVVKKKKSNPDSNDEDSKPIEMHYKGKKEDDFF